MKDAELIVVVVPSVAMRSVAQRLRDLPVRPDAVIVSCTKGIEQGSHKRMTEILQEYLPSNPIGVLSGPNHAEDICLGLPSASLIGFEDPKYADWVQQIFASKTFRVYSATDIIGMQLGGTIKNVFAIGAGLCEGLNLGDNAQAALLTRGLAEMTRIGVASGGRRETFMGLSGVGDLIVTCYSRHSRNQTVGRRLAEGKSLQEILDALGMVAEGVPNTLSVYEIARKLGVRTPLIDAVYSVLYESKPPMEALVELMTRDPRPGIRLIFCFFELLSLDKLYYINNQYETCHHLSSFCRRRHRCRQCGHSGSTRFRIHPHPQAGPRHRQHHLLR